jgi:hypothetical protein
MTIMDMVKSKAAKLAFRRRILKRANGGKAVCCVKPAQASPLRHIHTAQSIGA